MQLHTSSITLRIMAASLCYSILLTYPTVGSCTAFFFSRKGGRRCKETVGECFLYTGTSLPPRLPYISICDEVTEIRRQTFLFFFLSSMTVGYIVPMIPFFLPTTPSLMSTNFFTLLFREILYILIGEPNTCYWKGN